jgi:sugar phosphate isomerase/epimerase
MAATVAGMVAGFPALSSASGEKGYFERHHLRYGVQLFPVSAELGADLHGTFARLAALGYQDVETAGLQGHSVAALKAAADAAGLRILSAHVSAQIRLSEQDVVLTDEPGPVIEQLQALGVRHAVMPMPLLPADAVPALDAQIISKIVALAAAFGVSDWQRTADFMNRRAEAFAKAGIGFSYHNHNLEFAPVGGTTGWDVLVRETDPALVTFELDIGWAAAAGLDPVGLLEKNAGRMRMMHLKDIDRNTVPNFELKQISCPLGQGIVDWPGLLRSARRHGVFGCFVEQEPPFADGPFTALEQNINFLKSLRG